MKGGEIRLINARSHSLPKTILSIFVKKKLHVHIIVVFNSYLISFNGKVCNIYLFFYDF